jgi:tRNA(Arg) A34 adenosine deaminase TadA
MAAQPLPIHPRRGRHPVEITPAKRDRIERWRQQFREYTPQAAYPDDEYVKTTILLAIEAVNLGDFGIGCILLDGNGNQVAAGHNELFMPYFRSDRHGEMVVMDAWEKANPQATSMEGYKLYTSLESCPMCMARLISSGCQTVLYAAADPTGGMVHLINNLPSVWIGLAAPPRQNWGAANCSPLLQQAATKVFMENAAELNQILENR